MLKSNKKLSVTLELVRTAIIKHTKGLSTTLLNYKTVQNIIKMSIILIALLFLLFLTSLLK